MKYEEFGAATILKEFTGIDSNPVTCIFDSISAGKTKFPKSLKDLLPSSLGQDTKAVPLSMFGCPVCKEIYWTEEEAQNCSNLEQEFISAFQDLKTGQFVIWKDPHTGFPLLHECTNITHVWNGNKCGNIMTVHLDEKIFIDAQKWEMYHRLIRPISKQEKEQIIEIQKKIKSQARKLMIQREKEENDILESNAIRIVIKKMKDNGEWKSFFHF